MKKLISGILSLVILLSGCAASAEEVYACGAAGVQAQFARYAAYAVDADGGWTSRDIVSARILAEAGAGSVKERMNAGTALLAPSVRGDGEHGYVEAVLHVYVFRHSPVNVSGISIVTGGVRYDVITGAAAEKIGAYACERVDIPLDKTGLEMLESISENGCSLYVYGEGRPFTAEIVSDGELAAVRSLLAELPENYSGEYGLWDENVSRWPDDRKRIDAVVTGSGGEYDDMLMAPFDIMDTSAGDSVKRLQEKLGENGFYTGSADGKFAAGTRSAVLAAQRYYGLMETGVPDRRLLDCLWGGSIAAEGQKNPADSLTDCGMVRISIDGYWFADRVTPAGGMHAGNDVSPLSSGNTLLAACGTIVNADAGEIQLPIVMSARLVLDGKYTYPCSVRCEKNGASYYETSLIPLEEARLVIYAEVPAAAMEIEDRKLIITIYDGSGENDLEYSLK